MTSSVQYPPRLRTVRAERVLRADRVSPNMNASLAVQDNFVAHLEQARERRVRLIKELDILGREISALEASEKAVRQLTTIQMERITDARNC